MAQITSRFSKTQGDFVPLGELCEKVRQTDMRTVSIDAFEYIDVSSVSHELLRIESTTTYTPDSAPSRARKPVRPGDVIFATIRPSLRRIAVVPSGYHTPIVSSAFCVLRPREERIDREFLFYSVLSPNFIQSVSRLQRGASYPAVTDSDVFRQDIWLPQDRAIQRAIASSIRPLFQSIQESSQRLELLAELKAATMAKLFREGLRGEPLKQTEIGEIPESWDVVELAALLREPLRNGHSARATNQDHGVPTFSLTAVTYDDFSDENVKLTEADPHAVKELWLKSGDILIERANTPELVGTAALYRGSDGKAIFPDLIVRVRVDEKRVEAPFLAEWLTQPAIRRFYRQAARGSATSMPKIDQPTIGRTPVSLPSPTEQRRISEIGRMLRSTIEQTRENSKLMLELLESTLEEVFGTIP